MTAGLSETAGSHMVRSGQLPGIPTVHIPGMDWSGWCRRHTQGPYTHIHTTYTPSGTTQALSL